MANEVAHYYYYYVLFYLFLFFICFIIIVIIINDSLYSDSRNSGISNKQQLVEFGIIIHL